MWKSHPNPLSASSAGGTQDFTQARNCFGLTRRFQFVARTPIDTGETDADVYETIFPKRTGRLSSFARLGQSGSVWPLDSFMLSNACIDADSAGEFSTFGRLHMTATAVAHTFPAGELMMVPWDPIIFTGTHGNGTFQAVREGQHFTHHKCSRIL